MKTLALAFAFVVAMIGGANAVCVGPVAGASNTATSGCQNIKVPGAVVVTDGTHQTTVEPGMIRSNNGADHNTIVTPDGVAVYDNGAITTVESHEVTIRGTAVKQTLDAHTGQIGSLETVTAGHAKRLTAHDALLSEYAATLKDHARGLAIATAMPDAWLSDKKNFGVFASMGGFGDETAFGFAAIGRLDETFSVNAKLGADSSLKDFGWQVGMGAQW